MRNLQSKKFARLSDHELVQAAKSLMVTVCTGIVAFGAIATGFGEAADAPPQPTPEQIQFFEKHVRPLLVEQCQKCHNEKNSKGGLRLDTRGHILLGGESGAAIELGKPDSSLLMEAVRYESFEMPPSKKLDDAQIEVLSKWIAMGAPWPGDDGKVALRTQGDVFSKEDREWWAFQPVVRQVPPEDVPQADWCRNEIDRFISVRHEKEQLAPAPEAERRALIRRVYFDLIGMPPSAEAIQNFENDPDPNAYEKLVDSLLARPEYGERWARHWLDLVRYADSDGFRADSYRPEAWRYRDYVIQSFNEDKPYDQFVREQLAGDELYPENPDAMVATGFLRHGIYEYNARDVRGQWENILNEVTDVTGDVFFGMGFQCARCHDHKYDPILQKDYFQLRAFFEPIVWRDDVIAATPEARAEHARKLEVYNEKTKEIRAELDAIVQEYLNRGERTAVERFPDDIKAMIKKAPAERTPQEEQLVRLAWRQVVYEHERVDGIIRGETKDKVLALRRQLAAFDNIKPAPLMLPMVVKDVGPTPPKTIIPKRKIEVEPGFPTILESELPQIPPPEKVADSTGRRSVLAKWLTRPENPMTTRVIVNRIWQYHFGKGLVENSSDFGRLGEPPTHPELLDWLTTRFVDGGWKFKDLHRLIVTSATYRQSASHPQMAALQEIDPGNKWYWRGETRRLDAEQIRDAIFVVSGQLSSERGGPGVLPDRPRRSIYTRIMRNARDSLMDVFDLPQFFSSTSNRNTTTSPVQSLLLINSQTMLKHASDVAKSVKKGQEASGDTAPLIERLWWQVLGRAPEAHELVVAQTFLKEQEQRIRQNQVAPVSDKLVTGKMPYRDGQALLFQPEVDKGLLSVPHDSRLEFGDFTVEAFFQLRSVYDSGSVRTIASMWSGRSSDSGWAFGVTGKGSRRKPQTLVMQMFGKNQDGAVVEAAMFSDHHIELNKPYFAAATVRMAKDGKPGQIHFYLKDLSNDDEPMFVAEFPHKLVSATNTQDALMIGSRGRDGRFHGLIDDIRVSRGVLPQADLLLTSERVAPATAGYWRFDPNPGIFQDTCPEGLGIRSSADEQQHASPTELAFVDLCHVLLNSSEFLYVD